MPRAGRRRNSSLSLPIPVSPYRSLPNIIGRIFEIPNVGNRSRAWPCRLSLTLAVSLQPAITQTPRRSLLLFRRSFFISFLAQVRRLILCFRFTFVEPFSCATICCDRLRMQQTIRLNYTFAVFHRASRVQQALKCYLSQKYSAIEAEHPLRF